MVYEFRLLFFILILISLTYFAITFDREVEEGIAMEFDY